VDGAVSEETTTQAQPQEAEVLGKVEEFWWTTTYVAKSWWRDELVFARWVLEEDIKNGEMRRLLEWRLELDHDWSLRPGVYGRGLKRLLPPDIWSELASTYVGPEIEANWEALFRTTALFRRVAQEVAGALGFSYPRMMDDRVTAHLNAIRRWPPGAAP
jgi:aminoglycoside 6-adenylyltransferase